MLVPGVSSTLLLLYLGYRRKEDLLYGMFSESNTLWDSYLIDKVCILVHFISLGVLC